MRGVPPVHLEVELALPAVEREPGLLRRVPAGALDRGEVLREHDPALQLAPAGIAASREIDGPAGRPEAVPVLLGGPAGGLEAGERLVEGRGGEGHDRLQGLPVSGRLEDEVVLRLLLEPAGRGPGEPDVVAVVVETALEVGASRRPADEHRRVRLRPGPVRCGRVARAVGEANADRDAPPPDERRDDPHRDEVQARVAERLHRHLFSLEPEAAAERAVPEIEDLLDAGDVRGRRGSAVLEGQPEADAAEVQAMGVLPQPLDLGRPAVARDVRVAGGVPVPLERREAEPVDRPAGRVGGGVPAPLRQGAEGDRLVVGLGEGLEAGRVGGEGDLAVPDRQGRPGVEGPDDRAVAIDEGVPIDREWRAVALAPPRAAVRARAAGFKRRPSPRRRACGSGPRLRAAAGAPRVRR